jgi:ATP-binding cassette subfamily F protein 3
MISVDGLTVEFGGTTLFKDISFVINDKDRIALTAKPGLPHNKILWITSEIKN